MNKAERNRWVRLTLVSREGSLTLDYEDGRHRTFRLSKRVAARTAVLAGRGEVLIPAQIDAWLKEMLYSEPSERETAYGSKYIPLAIFVNDDYLSFAGFPGLFTEILTGRPFQFIADTGAAAVSAFQFPLKVFIAGSDHREISSKVSIWHW